MKKKIVWLIITILYFGGLPFATATMAEPEESAPFIFGYFLPPAVDPLLSNENVAQDVILHHLEGLFGHNYTSPKSSLIPRLAKDEGIWNDNDTEWTIELREDVFWHDGTSFTALDVKWNWDRLNYFAQEGLSPHSYIWFNDEGNLIINETIVINDHTVKFVLNKDWKEIVLLQSFVGCYMIKPIVGKEHTGIDLEEFDLLIGTGPFTLAEINQTSGEVIFLANNDYYRGAPDIQKLVFKQYDTWTEERQAIMDHEIHMVWETHLDDLQYFKTDPDLGYGTHPIAATRFYHLNVDEIDWTVRKAMQYAFDYDNYIAETETVHTKLNHPIPQGMIGFNPDLPGLPYTDLDVARQYIIDDPVYGPLIAARVNDTDEDQAWKDCATNDPIAIYNITIWREGLRSFAQPFVTDMAYIGVNISIEVVPYPDFGYHTHAIAFQLWYPDYWHPLSMLEPFFQSNAPYNYNGLANTTIDNLMAEAHRVIGPELETKVDEIATGIIVEQAAAMYFAQQMVTRGWCSKYVSSVEDIFTSAGHTYLYNVEFTLSEAPLPDTTISGFSLISLVLGFIGTVVLLQFRKYNTRNC